MSTRQPAADCMRRQFEERFQLELEKINQSLSRKGGVKKTDKVNQRMASGDLRQLREFFFTAK